MGGKSGGGSTSIQDVPPEFKPAYYRLFNSGFAAAQQGSQNPFAGPGGGFQGYPNPYANYPWGGTIGRGDGWGGPQGQPQGQPQGAPQQGMPPGQDPMQGAGAPKGGTLQQGQFPGQQQGQQQGLLPGQQPPQQQGLYPGQIGQQTWWGSQFPTPPGSTGGTQSIPLSGGPPITGSPFPGPFTAPTTGVELESLMQREAIGRQLQGIGNPLLGLGQQQAMGQFLNPYTNPAFQQNLYASLQPAVDQFTRSTMPQFNSQAIQSGAFKGSSARDFAFNDLANTFGRNLAQTAGQLGSQQYQQERQIQQGTPQLLQQATGLQQLTPEILAQVGAGQREILQRPLDELLLQFQEYQQAPFRPLGPLASLIQGTNIGTTQTLNPQRPSPVASGIAGALGGAGLGLGAASSLGLGTAGSAGAGGLGALLGGLGGALI